MKTPEYKIIDTKDIIPTPQNPRVVSDKQLKVIELSESILRSSTKMAYEPILVRIHPTKKGKYDLRDGERRLCASILAGVKKIPAVIHDWSDDEAFEVTVLLNLQREQLTPMEESRACKYLIENGDDLETAAARLGKPVSWVKRRASLTRIIDTIQEKIASHFLYANWGMGHLEIIAKLDPESQQQFLDEIDDNEWNFPHTIKELKEHLYEGKFYLVDASFDLDKEIAGKIPCLECPKRSSCTPELPGFEEKQSDKDMCFDPECYHEKSLATFDSLLEPMKEKYPDLVLIQGDGWDYEFIEKYKIKREWEYNKAKKSDAGTVPCLVVNIRDKKLGKTVSWRIPHKYSTHNDTPKKKADDMTLKEKREGLKKKRIKYSMEKLSNSNYEAIEFCDDVLEFENLIALVATLHGAHWGVDIFRELKNVKKEGALEMITNWIQDELTQYLNLNGTLDTINDKYPKQILSLIKDGDKKWLAFMEDAAKEIKEPKSWTKK